MGVISVMSWRLRLYHVVLLIVGVLVSTIVVFQCCGIPSWTMYPMLDGFDVVDVSTVSNAMPIATYKPKLNQDDAYEKEATLDNELESDGGINSFEVENHEDEVFGFTQKLPKYANDSIQKDLEIDNRHSIHFESQGVPSKGSGMQNVEMQLQNEKKSQLLKTPTLVLNYESKIGTGTTPTVRRKLVMPTSITQMNSLLLQSSNSSSTRPRWASRRDRELLSAKLEIENARVVSNSSGLYAPIFRDVSKFSRSYEMMERKLKVYIYREGEKPIFHQPKMRGLYASEGWFMKLMEGNKRFVVRDPKKAHLFYLPFSSQMLRVTLSEQNLRGKHMEQYLERYVELIARKYRFWNRTEGADHFLVACHDWASQITRQPMKNCIRSLCNANVAKGFQIGKDTTLPVTYIHSMMNPLRGVAGKPPSERSILAFFAGGMHGYLRPILLKHWENKEPDMKIFGPMPRDLEGKKIYREYMNSSKYCICARGYEVHTPRIVEAIFSGCVPVIISDNYVPPLFEVLNWEAFSIFVSERDVPSLRNILVSIPRERYLALHLGVEKVKQHFQWHKIPVKYDLFHMILHAVWNNRLSQIRPR